MDTSSPTQHPTDNIDPALHHVGTVRQPSLRHILQNYASKRPIMIDQKKEFKSWGTLLD